MPKAFPPEMYSSLACVCGATTDLIKEDETLKCPSCGRSHAIVDGVPVILYSERSVFDAEDIIRRYRATNKSSQRSAFRTLRRFVPRISVNLIADHIGNRIRGMLSGIPHPRVLVVGGGEAGAGLKELLDEPSYTIVESDIYFGPRCNLIADGHNLPFKSDTFDLVICQAVLEHVVRPHACIDEIHRVLNPRGVFFADIPFMQPVHMGAYDFTRFSLGGLRLACRAFEEEGAGFSIGPFSAVTQTLWHAAQTVSDARIWKAFVWFGLPWMIFWLAQFDRLLRHRLQAADAASGVYFIGRKADRLRSEREIIRQYWRYQLQDRAQASVRTRPATEGIEKARVH
jgi:SAM-dependent methyltransferase